MLYIRKNKKSKKRKNVQNIKKQLNDSFNNMNGNERKIESISKRIHALNDKYPGLKKHFKDFFSVNKLCDCSICMDEINVTDKYHICSNPNCGLLFHVIVLNKPHHK